MSKDLDKSNLDIDFLCIPTALLVSLTQINSVLNEDYWIRIIDNSNLTVCTSIELDIQKEVSSIV